MKPKAFVLMPFAPEFEDIYSFLIKEGLTLAGFDVIKANDLITQNNILKGIIDSIVNSDLILADLSGANPNVYYELGIAHALNKPVILLTQDISDLPFDLRSYRVISYQTHFSKMNQARTELIELGKEALAGKVPFGNPVSDFTNLQPPTLEKSYSSQKSHSNQETVLGYLDYMVNLEEGLEVLGLIITAVGEELNKTTPNINDATMKLSDSSSTKQKRDALRKLAGHIENYGLFLKPRNVEYRNKLQEVEKSLEFLLSGNVPHDDNDGLVAFVTTLDGVEKASYEGRRSFMALVETMDSLVNFERNFDKSNKFMSQELKTFIGNIDQTISVISRAKVAGNNLITTTTNTN